MTATLIPIIVLDTSYLLELYKVDGNYQTEAHNAIVQKFRQAIESKWQFFVPVAVLFELANHIADITTFERRKYLSQKLKEV